MSEAIPVNWAGCRCVSATDPTPVKVNTKSRTPVSTFPNGRPCPAGTMQDFYGRFCVNEPGVNMSADGEAYNQLITPISYVQGALNTEPGQTLAQRNETLIEYCIFIRDYIPGDPAQDADATAWAARAAAVSPGYASLSIAHVQADAVQIKTVKYNTTMHQF